MRNFIIELIDRFGGRRAGSLAEEKAQDFLQEKFAKHTRVERHRFTEHLTAHFSSLRIFCWLYYLSLLVEHYSLRTAFVIAAVNAVLFHGHFVSYRGWLNFLFKKRSSSNVIATIEPRKKATNTLIFSAHIDSTPEFIWWYKLKNLGGFLTFISGFAFTFWPLVLLAEMSFSFKLETLEAFSLIFSILALPTLSLYFIHGNRIVAGAMDNLSGISILMQLSKQLIKKKGQKVELLLNHTRIKFISFGSEEPGLKGSKAYTKDHLEQLTEENSVIINIDGIMKKNKLRIIFHEVNPAVNYPQWLVEKIKDAFTENNIEPSRGIIAVGATDAASFAAINLPTLSIVGQTLYKLDPEYHTRLDVPEAVENEALEAVNAILFTFVKNWDSKVR